jgi:uncharacterized membrane protein
MDWLFFALIPPFLFALSNRIDKYLLEGFFKGQTGALILFSCFISLLTLPIIYLIQPSVLSTPFFYSVVMILVGFLYVAYLFPYFWALKLEEASKVIPIFQAIPLFGVVLGFFILGDTLSVNQIIAGAFILIAAFGLSADIGFRKIVFKKRVVLFALFASFLIALSYVLLKLVAINTDFFTALFWEQVGCFILGLFLLTKKSYRVQFMQVFKINSKKIIGLNIFNEIINILAHFIFAYATLLVPVGLVWIVNGSGPFFVLSFGIIITLFFPQFGKEDISKKSLFQKAFFIGLMIIGAAILGLA